MAYDWQNVKNQVNCMVMFLTDINNKKCHWLQAYYLQYKVMDAQLIDCHLN